MTAPRILALLLIVALLSSCSARRSSQDAVRTREEIERTKAINELLTFFEKRMAKTPSESEPGSVKHYRNGLAPEVVCEVRYAQQPKETLTTEEVRSHARKMIGTYFTVGDIR